MHTTDPFATALGGSVGEEYPNAKRNLLEDLNSAGAEQTVMLPPPPQKENISVYLRSVRKLQKLIKSTFLRFSCQGETNNGPRKRNCVAISRSRLQVRGGRGNRPLPQ